MNYYEQQEDVGSNAIKLALAIGLAGGIGTLGLTWAAGQIDVGFASIVLFSGLAITVFLCISTVFGAWQSIDYRA